MDMGLELWSSPSSSSTTDRGGTAWPWPSKRPAGRTKFRETRHPVFRGVRRRGSAGRWVCEVRVPGERGTRLWLGTYVTAEAAARAHDAGMLMLRGPSAACLNFRDSAWLLDVPPAFSNLSDIRRAAVQAVADFLRRPETTSAAAAAAAIQEATSSVSTPSSPACSVRSSEAAETSADAAFEAQDPLDMSMFELDCLFGETDFDTYYYANLAQGLLMEPPPTSATGPYGDCADDVAGADVALWSY